MTCKICNDTGIENGGPCKCRVKVAMQSFCGVYSSFELDKNYASSLLWKDILFTDVKNSTFGRMTFSFLSYLFMTIKPSPVWISTDGNEIMASYFQNSETLSEDYINCDFLVLKLGRDPRNAIMEEVILNILTKRKELQNLTWVYVYDNYDAIKMEDKYGSPLMQFLKCRNNLGSVSSYCQYARLMVNL